MAAVVSPACSSGSECPECWDWVLVMAESKFICSFALSVTLV